MSAHEDLEKSARAAGAAGTTYDRWAGSDEVFLAANALGRDADFDKFEAAFCEGRREYRAGGGWKSVWTTAPADYDGFGTETAESPVEWKGRQLRKVLVDPAFHDWQTGRYGSGGHCDWDEDPREIEAKLTAKLAAEKAEIEAMLAKRDAGLAWIRTADRALLDDEFSDALDAELRSRALTWKDRSDEIRRRDAESAEVVRAEKWARCRAAFADGASLIDPGSVGHEGKYGWIQGRETRAWREVRVVEHYSASEDAEQARVVAEGGVELGSLEYVADKLAGGELRLAAPEDHVPPKAVLDRLGSYVRWDDVLRVEVRGAAVWVGRPLGSVGALVLDDRGHLVRRKAVYEPAADAFRAHYFGGAKLGRSVALFACEHAGTRVVWFAVGDQRREVEVCTSCGAARSSASEWKDAGSLELNLCGAWPEDARVDLVADPLREVARDAMRDSIEREIAGKPPRAWEEAWAVREAAKPPGAQ